MAEQMAIEQLYSNILLLNNIDTTALEEKIIVKFAKTDDNPRELFDSPSDIELQEGEQIYAGIYIGADTDEPIWQDYTWRIYNYEESHINNVVHIDIRYGFLENDTYKFTEEKNSEGNLIPTGKSKENATYKGVFVTQDPSVMEDDWYPGFNNNITAENYFWTRYIPKEKSSFFYKVKLYKNANKNEEIINIYKFIEDNTSKYDPSNIYYELIQVSNGAEQVINESNCSYQLVYKIINPDTGDEELYITEVLTPIDGVIQLNTQTDEDENKDGIQTNSEEVTNDQQAVISRKEVIQIIFNFSKNNQIFYTETKEINYRTEESIARLAINANDIVASIANAKLKFSEDGLQIKNGGFEILNDRGNRVLYSENGNLKLSGSITADSGKIGTWFIDNTGLVAKENGDENGKELAGLYGSNANASINDSPILIWAGKGKDDTYKFAVTADGYAQVSGSIIASSGRIQNNFYVGDDNGIIISGGNENSQSYISTSNFASGSLGYGWKLSQDGSAEFSNITARGKIQSSVFEHNKINSVGGSLYIAPTIYIEDASDELMENEDTSEYTVTWDKLPYSINVSENNYQLNVNGTVWEKDDTLKIDGIVINKIIKENIATPVVENEGTEGTVEENEQETDNNNYEWTTNLADIDAKIIDIQPIVNENGTDLSSGKLTIKFKYSINDPYSNEKGKRIRNFLSGAILLWQGGKDAKRGLYLTATDSGGPFIDVYDYNTDSNNIPKVRIGNLKGVQDSDFTSSFSDYGLYASNAYLRGQLILPGAGITNQNTETYGVGENSSPIRIWAGSNSADMKNANFIVTENGYMYAKQGIFEGTVIAANSEFSGTIKAAGIIIDNLNTPKPEAEKDHFFVAYTENPSTFNDYVLDISSTGLSIWEGGLRAYSDKAGEIKNSIYGYFKDFLEPLPFFFLVDDADPNNKVLNSRMVAHKAHFLQIEENFETNEGYSINSIILDNGIWLYKGDGTEAKKDIESQIFHGQSGVTGLNLKEEALQIQGKNINLVSLGEININSPVKLSNQNENLISFGGHIIKETRIAVLNENQKEEIKSIGFDFIIN